MVLTVDPVLRFLVSTFQTQAWERTDSRARFPNYLEFIEEARSPWQVALLKLDFWIKTSLSVGVGGVVGACAYFFAFSNFHKRQRSGASHD